MATDKRYSTSALAKRIGVPVKHVFNLLSEHGWIKRQNERWVLTGKGEFEGGEYTQSERFGEYISWPTDILDRQLLKSAAAHMTLSAAELGAGWHMPGRYMERLLAELGWMTPTVKGWELTDEGRQRHGIQLENDDTGALYCVWEVAVREEPALVNLIAALQQVDSDDLFSEFRSIDGHACPTVARKQLCDWLYLVGLNHACDREISELGLLADIYLPIHRIYIECWQAAEAAHLADKMRIKNWATKHGIAYIEVDEEVLDDLDHRLAKLLLEHGVKVY